MSAPALDLERAIAALWTRRAFVGVMLALSLVIGVVLAFVLPSTYTAMAVILPPVDSDPLASIQGARRALTSFSALGLLSQTFTPADEYQAILKSETLHRAIVQRFDLMSVYKVRNLDLAVRVLRTHARVNLSADGSISVSVEDRDRQRCADMANAFTEELDKFNQQRRRDRARAQRIFLETRLGATQAELATSEVAVRAFGEKEHTPVISGAERAAAEGAAALLSRRAALEVRRQILQAYLEPGSDELQQVTQELSSLDAEIVKLPAIEMEGARLLRDLRVQEELFVLLRSQVEEMKIRENFNVPTVELMDRAHVPDMRSSPIRKQVIAGALAVGLVIAAAGVFWMELRAGSQGRGVRA